VKGCGPDQLETVILLDTWTAFVEILDASALYILAGFLLAGILHAVLDRRESLLDPLRGKGPKPVLLSALIGVPLPLCSCSVLPTAVALRRGGAGKGATASFLITVPETDIVSILLTWGLLGPVMAIARPVASLFTGLTAGLAIDADERSEAPAPAADPLAMAPPPATGGGCCCHSQAAPAAPDPTPAQRAGAWLRDTFRFGFVTFFDNLVLLLLGGLLLSAAIGAIFPRLETTLLTQGHLLSYLLMLLVGIPMYICATASTPVAAALVAAGLSPGAALILLLTGPATNSAGLLMVRREFGNRSFAIYLGTVVVTSLLAGMLLDLLVLKTPLPSPIASIGGHVHEEAGARWATWLFLLLSAAAIIRRLRGRLASRKD